MVVRLYYHFLELLQRQEQEESDADRRPKCTTTLYHPGMNVEDGRNSNHA
jgi:hypothetical protein